MKFKKKISIDTKLAGKGIRYDPNFVVTDDDFKDLTNRDVRLKDLKNVHGSPSRITRSQDLVVIRKKIKKNSDSKNDEYDGKSSKGKEKITVTDEGDTLVPPKKSKKRNRSNDGEDDAQSSKKKSKKAPWKRKLLKLTDFEVWDLFLSPSDNYKCQLSVHTSCGFVTALKSKLDKKQLDLLKNSCVGYFLSLPSVFPQNQHIHGMLLRELVCERDDEIWIKCWFYECYPYADGHLVDRVGDGVSRILNWFVKYRPTYKEVKSAFFDIRQEQVVLRNITSTVLEKTILQLPDFKSVDAVVPLLICLAPINKSVLTEKVSSMEKFMKSSFELIFRALDIKNEPKVGTSIGDIDGDNSNEKDDETPNIDGTGNDQVNDPPNVGHQNDVVPKVDHISDNLMDDVGKIIDCVGGERPGKWVPERPTVLEATSSPKLTL
ncbi:hypothetical protein FXO37_13871 [Capsicum annuum]|nr:hypothetical protein FXO37_13871 [Capsicum annuum]